MNNQVIAFIDANDNMTAREIFALANKEGKNRGFLITLATALIQTGRFVL